jgi:hypothetical protein
MLGTLLHQAALAAPLIFLGWYAFFLVRRVQTGLTIKRIFLSFTWALAAAAASWLVLLLVLLVFYPLMVHR